MFVIFYDILCYGLSLANSDIQHRTQTIQPTKQSTNSYPLVDYFVILIKHSKHHYFKLFCMTCVQHTTNQQTPPKNENRGGCEGVFHYRYSFTISLNSSQRLSFNVGSESSGRDTNGRGQLPVINTVPFCLIII